MGKAEARHIEAYLRQEQKEMESFLKELVAMETPSGDPASLKKLLEFLEVSLEELAFRTERIPGRQSGGFLLAVPRDRKKGAPLQLLLGHCDTVWPKNTLQEMPILEAEDRISGPGVFDMKAGLTQMVFAIKSLRDLKIEIPVTPVILVNSDEETGSRESSMAIKRLSRIASRAFVLEPPLGLEGKLKTSRKGIGRFHLRVKGKPAHAGLNPDKGVSAIVELSYQIQQLFAMNDFKKGITVNVGMIQGGSSANVIAAEGQAVIDVRVKNMEDADYIAQRIRNLKPRQPEVELYIDGYFGRPPLERTARNRKLWRLAKNLGSWIDLELEEAEAGGGSDGNTTSQYTATLDGLGTSGDGAHARHEFILRDKLVERTTLLSLLLAAPPMEK